MMTLRVTGKALQRGNNCWRSPSTISSVLNIPPGQKCKVGSHRLYRLVTRSKSGLLKYRRYTELALQLVPKHLQNTATVCYYFTTRFSSSNFLSLILQIVQLGNTFYLAKSVLFYQIFKKSARFSQTKPVTLFLKNFFPLALNRIWPLMAVIKPYF